MSAQSPALRVEMEKVFAGNALLDEFGRFMSARGYSSRNVADDMAALLWVCWEIVTGSTASKAQIRGAHQQVRGIFLGTPQLRAMTNAERQRMAELIAYQVMITSAAKIEIVRSGDQEQLAQLRQSAAALLLAQGIDLSQLRLTEKGFSKRS